MGALIVERRARRANSAPNAVPLALAEAMRQLAAHPAEQPEEEKCDFEAGFADEWTAQERPLSLIEDRLRQARSSLRFMLAKPKG